MVGLESAAPAFISVTTRLWRQYLSISVYNSIVYQRPELVAGYINSFAYGDAMPTSFLLFNSCVIVAPAAVAKTFDPVVV